ncbi:hypothetical protein M2G25_22200 [Vibrio vulnificus]|nr:MULTISPECIES: hypothetical protein [Vibrio]MCU8545155.1 hypothetical protein [Vibrio vulnificus]MCX8925954.1 hypothetical protein [Vibrio parahaemolyticus]
MRVSCGKLVYAAFTP